jgi:hypothetical protein
MEPECSLHVHKSPPPVPVLTQMNSIYTPKTIFRSINIDIILPSGLSPSGLPNQNIVRISHLPMRTAYLAHLTLLDVIILIISGEGYELWSSSLCNFLQPVISSLLRSKYSPQHTVLHTVRLIRWLLVHCQWANLASFYGRS